jgi:flagellar protein FlhE
MMNKWLVGWLLLTPMAVAADGSWTSQSFGGTLTQGKQVQKSKPIEAPSPLPSSAVATRLVWKIKADNPPPDGFRIRLCSEIRCIALPGLAGEIPLAAGFAVAGPYRFEYFSLVRGRLTPPLTVLSNQVTVSYRTTR